MGGLWILFELFELIELFELFAISFQLIYLYFIALHCIASTYLLIFHSTLGYELIYDTGFTFASTIIFP